MHHTGPFTIREIRDIVPKPLKPWLMFFFFIIFQFSGGVYMAAVTEMSGGLALMQEDILMAGFASLVGLALTFTVMFRLKFRFSTKMALLISTIGLIVSNFICMNTSHVALLVAVSFVSGFFRMWGTFACNSAIQLWVTPKRDMAVWFCYIQFFVQAFLQLSGLTTIYISLLLKWEFMHWFIIGALGCMLLFIVVFFEHKQTLPKKLPLYGIDWLGAALWAVTLLCAIFVLNYGEYYDWYESYAIWTGTFVACAALVLNLWRASFIRHPFIANQTWRYRNVWLTLLLLIVVNILMSPAHEFEHILTGGILGYDAMHIVSLNWYVLLGMFIGALFMYVTFALRKWKYKTMTLIGFTLLVSYLAIMYFIIDYNLPKSMLFLPLLLRGIGYITITITFITALSVVPFQYFAQTLTIQAFISACCGSLLGSAVLTHIFRAVSQKNFMLLSTNLDRVNTLAAHYSPQQLYGSLQQQTMLVSMKEIYGWLCIAGVFCIIVFMLKESTLRPKSLHPKFSTIRRYFKHELKIERLIKQE